MVRDDEDDAFISVNDRLLHADPRREALKRQVEQKTGRDSAGKDLSELKKEVVASKEGVKPPVADEAQSSSAPKTKTILQQEKDDVATAQDKPNPDTLIERQENATPVSGEEVQSEPG